MSRVSAVRLRGKKFADGGDLIRAAKESGESYGGTVALRMAGIPARTGAASV